MDQAYHDKFGSFQSMAEWCKPSNSGRIILLQYLEFQPSNYFLKVYLKKLGTYQQPVRSIDFHGRTSLSCITIPNAITNLVHLLYVADVQL